MVLVVAVAALFVLFVIPFPHSFSQAVTTEAYPGIGAGATQLSFPRGSTVSGSYSSGLLGVSALLIWDSSGNVVFNGTGLSGSFAFVASNPPYYAAAICLCLGSVTMSGTYNSPLI